MLLDRFHDWLCRTGTSVELFLELTEYPPMQRACVRSLIGLLPWLNIHDDMHIEYDDGHLMFGWPEDEEHYTYLSVTPKGDVTLTIFSPDKNIQPISMTTLGEISAYFNETLAGIVENKGVSHSVGRFAQRCAMMAINLTTR